MKRRSWLLFLLPALLLCACADRNAERVLPLADPDAERLARVASAAETAAAPPTETVTPLETEAPSETEAPIDRGTPETAGEFALVGSRLSDKYHDPSCRYAQKIDPENRIGWESAAAAGAEGYVPCGVCKPG